MVELHIRCIRALATETYGKILITSTRTHGETQLSPGWTLIRSELSSPNINSSVRAERSFAIRYLNVVVKPLCGNLDICLNYYFRSRNSVRVLAVAESISVAKNPSTRMHQMSQLML